MKLILRVDVKGMFFMTNVLFSDDQVQGRFLDFFDMAQNFCEKYNLNQEITAEIDPSKLYLVVVATYDDIARYKLYHLVNPSQKRASAIKRAAYATKWIMRFNPIIFPANGHLTGLNKTEDYDTLANAMFAIHFSQTCLRKFTGKFFTIDREKSYTLMYDLLYRSISSDSLILFYETLCDIVLAKNVIK